jgi:threonine synthase
VETKATLAEGIAIVRPVRGRQIIAAVRQTGGEFITVSEGEIKKSLLAMGRLGYCIEPTSAATIAGIKKYFPRSGQNEIIVSVFTGHGLKATEKMLKFFP